MEEILPKPPPLTSTDALIIYAKEENKMIGKSEETTKTNTQYNNKNKRKIQVMILPVSTNTHKVV